jgi:small conductance mechanosensitive channel
MNLKALLAQAAQPQSWTHRLAGVSVAVLVAALLYLVIFLVERRLKRSLARRLQALPGMSPARLRPMVSSISVAASLARWVVVLLALLYVLISVGINPLPVLTGVGVLGAAIAIGSQSVVKDLVTGLFMLLEGQYAEGEYVALNGTVGRVAEVGFRVTVLETPDGKRQYFPHGGITTVCVYPQPEAGFELLTPATTPEAVERLAPLLAELGEAMVETFPGRVLRAEAPEAYGGAAAPGLRQRVVVRPGQEGLVTEEWVARIQALQEAQGLQPPGGLVPTARPSCK